MKLQTFIKNTLINKVVSKELSRKDYPNINDYIKALRLHATSFFTIVEGHKVRSPHLNVIKEALFELSIPFKENVFFVDYLNTECEIIIEQRDLPKVDIRLPKANNPKDDLAKENLVVEIFELRNKGCSLQEIGDKLGFTREYIRQILNGRSAFSRQAIEKHKLKINPVKLYLGKTPFDKYKIKEIIGLIETGTHPEVIAKKYNTNESSIQNLFKNPILDPLFEELNVNSKAICKKIKSNYKRFSEEDIKRIFELHKTKRQVEIADMYDTTQSHISAVLTGRLYRQEINDMGLKAPNKPRKYTEKDVIKIFELRNSGNSLKEIAKKFKTKDSYISLIINGRIYNDVIQKHNLSYIKAS